MIPFRWFNIVLMWWFVVEIFGKINDTWTQSISLTMYSCLFKQKYHLKIPSCCFPIKKESFRLKQYWKFQIKVEYPVGFSFRLLRF